MMSTDSNEHRLDGKKDKLLQLLDEIPDKATRSEILRILHNAMIEHPQAYVHVTDVEGKLLFLNKSIRGFEREAILGKSFMDDIFKVSKQQMKELYALFGDVLKGKTVSREAYTIFDKDGNKRIFRGTIKPVLKEGKVAYVVTISYEITYEKEIQKLKKTKQLFEEKGTDFFACRIHVPSGQCDYISPSVRDIVGWDLRENKNAVSSFIELLHPDYVEEVQQHWENVLSGDIPPVITYQLRTRHKGYRVFQQMNSGVYDDSGNLIAIEIIARDITEYTSLDRKFKELEDKFNRVLKDGKVSLFTATYGKDAKHIMESSSVVFTESVQNITGYTAKAFYEDPQLWIKIAHPKDFNRIVEEYGRQLERGDELNIISRFIRNDGFIGKIKIWGRILRDDEGKPVRVDGIAMDISDKDVYDELLDYFAQRIVEDELKKNTSDEHSYIR